MSTEKDKKKKRRKEFQLQVLLFPNSDIEVINEFFQERYEDG